MADNKEEKKTEAPGESLYVGNLPFNATEDELKELFEQYGTVKSVGIVVDPATSKPKGFAFIVMETTEAAQLAVKELDDSDYNGRQIRVNVAKAKKPYVPPSRGRGRAEPYNTTGRKSVSDFRSYGRGGKK